MALATRRRTAGVLRGDELVAAKAAQRNIE